MKSSHDITLVFSEDLLKKAVRAFWWRTIGLSYVIAFGIVLFCAAYLYFDGDRTWKFGLTVALVLFGAAMPLLVYVTHYRNTLGKFRALKGENATLRISPEFLGMESFIGKTSIKWSSVEELWRFDEFWLLLFSKGQFSTLPLSCLSESDRNAILKYVEAAGGKID